MNHFAAMVDGNVIARCPTLVIAWNAMRNCAQRDGINYLSAFNACGVYPITAAGVRYMERIGKTDARNSYTTLRGEYDTLSAGKCVWAMTPAEKSAMLLGPGKVTFSAPIINIPRAEPAPVEDDMAA